MSRTKKKAPRKQPKKRSANTDNVGLGILDEITKSRINKSYKTPVKIPVLEPLQLTMITPEEAVAVMTPDGTLRKTTAGEIEKALNSYRERAKDALNPIKTTVGNYSEAVKDDLNKSYPLTAGEFKSKIFGRNLNEIRVSSSDVLNIYIDGDGPIELSGKTLHDCIKAFTAREPEVMHGRPYEPQEIIADVLQKISGNEVIIPQFLGLLNEKVLQRLNHIREQARETSDVASKRFEETVIILRNVLPEAVKKI